MQFSPQYPQLLASPAQIIYGHYPPPGALFAAQTPFYGPPVNYQPQQPMVSQPEGVVQFPAQPSLLSPQQHHQWTLPPQYLAVNVRTDTSQSQTQHQDQTSQNTNKHLTVKKKVVRMASQGLEHLLDARILGTGLITLLLPMLKAKIQGSSKRKGVYMGFGQFPS